MPDMDIEKLNTIFRDSETADSEVFSEQRSNILLVSGDHYRKAKSGFERGLRKYGVGSSQKRLRLVKNHTQKITNDIKDIIVGLAPGVTPMPKNDTEMADQKAAELSRAVWMHGKDQLSWDDLIDKFVNSFVDIGECVAKIFFDPSRGGLRGYAQSTNEKDEPMFTDPEGNETNVPGIPGVEAREAMVDANTGMVLSEAVVGQEQVNFQPVANKEKPIFKGELVVEKVDPFNLLRAKNSTSIKDSPYLIVRKMMDLEKVKEIVGEDDEKLSKLTEASDTTFKVFDTGKGSFQDSKDMVLLKEYYFRQSLKYPEGYFYITTENDILYEGPIPFGEAGEIAFPIKYAGYDMLETSARHVSPIRPLRPYQAEINRTASSISETQITLGPDKLIIKGGSKVSKGVDLPGMRTIHVSGPDPIVLPGRSGDQYVGHLESQIGEMYKIARLPENSGDGNSTFDPRAELFKSVRQKARFTRQAARFERFLVEICETYLFLQQKYIQPDEMIRAVGKKEAINIPEFKDVDRLDYSVQIEPVSGDMDTMLGKAMELEMIMQYIGKDLPEDTKGKLLKNLPFLSKEHTFDELTIDDDNIESDLLATDRGERIEPGRYDNHDLYVKRITHRIKQSDFRYLEPQVQQMHEEKRKAHEDFLAQIQKELLESQKGLIPSGGALAKADLYVSVDPNDPSKTKRAQFPTESLEWLKEMLAKQGTTQSQLDMQDQVTQSEIMKQANQMVNQGPEQEQPQQQQLSGLPDQQF